LEVWKCLDLRATECLSLKPCGERRQPAERPTFPLGIRVEDRVPTQDIAGERLLMAAGALPCPCKDLGQEKKKADGKTSPDWKQG